MNRDVDFLETADQSRPAAPTFAAPAASSETGPSSVGNAATRPRVNMAVMGGRRSGRYYGDRHVHGMVGTQPVEFRGCAGEPGPLRGPRGCGASDGHAAQARELLSKACSQTMTRSFAAGLACVVRSQQRGRWNPAALRTSSTRAPAPVGSFREAAPRTARVLWGLYRTHRKANRQCCDATRGPEAGNGETGLRSSARPPVGDGLRR